MYRHLLLAVISKRSVGLPLVLFPWQSSADNYVNRLRKRYIPAQILKQINSEANRETIAAQLTPYLSLGAAGQILIDRVAVSDGSVRVRFTLPYAVKIGRC